MGQTTALHAETEGSALTQAQDAAKAQSRSSNASAMRAMHDSSSSWTDRLADSGDKQKGLQQASLESKKSHGQQHTATSSNWDEGVDQGKTAKSGSVGVTV